ncbi:MAG TPA: Gfo/Idh/MocA family oxidoreductase [Nakamurella sp.]|nr:Gfo/Idh/MocA family oxidoreductase [Nakamurella sp.]
MTADLRVGVVGVGARAAFLSKLDGLGARVLAVADPRPGAASRVAELFGDGVRIFPDHRLMCDAGPLDAVFVLSPDDTHAAIAVDLLERGIPVFLEKPIATTVADADRILAVGTQTRGTLYVGHNMRHMAVVRTLKGVIDRGEIGAVRAIWCRHFVGDGGEYYFKDWHAARSRSTGLLLQKGAHDIDVIHYLAGGYSTEVVGMGDLTVYGRITDRRDNADMLMPQWHSRDNWPPLTLTGLHPVVDVEDLSMMLMRLDGGVLASYQQCHYTPDYWRNYTVIGEAGRCENFGDGDGGVVRVWNRRSGYRADGDVQYPIRGDADGHGDADRATIAEFLELVRSGTPTETSPVAARNAVAAGIAATESLRDGSTPRRVNPVPDDVAAYYRARSSAAW